ncbi:hypothetical protein WT83_11525 [Burkholderia territorii]|uniref:Uncharacterized protein n=1 Tax=Burkholderia territorii TaxID=1503055 RepID=A0A108EV85_9BURK|nr:hypothetical protein WT83_11525 [Burkholderia territorii]
MRRAFETGLPPRDPAARAFGIGVFEFMPGVCRRDERESETMQPRYAAREACRDGEGANRVGAGETGRCAAQVGEHNDG